MTADFSALSRANWPQTALQAQAGKDGQRRRMQVKSEINNSVVWQEDLGQIAGLAVGEDHSNGWLIFSHWDREAE